jgi:leucyl-tRNA synthetase
MRDAGLVKSDEPFKRLLTQGMVCKETYFRDGENGRKQYFNPAQVDVELDAKGRAVTARAKSRRSAGHHRRGREDVEVEEQRRRSAGLDRSSTAPTPCACTPCSRRRRTNRWNGPIRRSKASSAS